MHVQIVVRMESSTFSSILDANFLVMTVDVLMNSLDLFVVMSCL
jgi:hypothetical protein